jgi:hypothetical protein
MLDIRCGMRDARHRSVRDTWRSGAAPLMRNSRMTGAALSTRPEHALRRRDR